MSSVDSGKVLAFDLATAMGEYFVTGETSDHESPNQIQGINFLPHALEVFFYDKDPARLEFTDRVSARKLKDAWSNLKTRKFPLNAVEFVGFSSSVGSRETFRELLESSVSPDKSRFFEYRVLSDSGEELEVFQEPFATDTKPWFTVNPLSPGRFPYDLKLSSFFQQRIQELTAHLGNATPADLDPQDSADPTNPEDLEEVEEFEDSADTGELDEAPEDSEDPDSSPDSDVRAELERIYRSRISNTVSFVLEEYAKVFASGYEVYPPTGVMVENSNGSGVLARLPRQTTGIEIDPIDTRIKEVYSKFKSVMGLREMKSRDLRDLRSVIVNQQDQNGVSFPLDSGSSVHFPYKVLEYAFGRTFNSSTSLQEYPPHSNRESWYAYADAEVRDNLTLILSSSIYAKLKSVDLLESAETMTSREAKACVDEISDNFLRVFCNLILVSKYDVTEEGIPSAIKLRVLSYACDLGEDNHLYNALLDDDPTISTNSNVTIYPVRHEKGRPFYEYVVELNTALANARPMFMYKAIQKSQEQGIPVTFSKAILGQDETDSIIRNGGDINFSDALISIVAAGSRSGKGVVTQSWLVPALNEPAPKGEEHQGIGYPLFYADNKPDIASFLRHKAPNGAFINGSANAYEPENGTDYFGSFREDKNPLPSGFMPSYLEGLFPANTYSGVGAVGYLRFVLLVHSIIIARVYASSHLDSLGGSRGIMAIFDEARNAGINLTTVFDKIKSHAVNSDHHMKWKAAKKRADATGNEMTFEPASAESFWLRGLYDTMRASVEYIQPFVTAGLYNGEHRASQIFVLTQDLPELVDPKTLLPPVNKSKLGVAMGSTSEAILNGLMIYGKTHIMLGFGNGDGRNFLNQENPKSKASRYLNSVKRNFCFIPNYSESMRADLMTEKYADRGTFFKPFLAFGDYRKDAYFADNMSKFLPKGVTLQDIIADNPNPTVPGEFNEGVGLEGLFKQAGIEGEELKKRLSKSGDIAQFAVDALGYPGSWREFIYDMRPEWFFATSDLTTVLNDPSVKLADINAKRQSEFREVHPEAFSTPIPVADDPVTFDDDLGNATPQPTQPVSFDDDFGSPTAPPSPSSAVPDSPAPTQPVSFGDDFGNAPNQPSAVPDPQGYQQSSPEFVATSGGQYRVQTVNPFGDVDPVSTGGSSSVDDFYGGSTGVPDFSAPSVDDVPTARLVDVSQPVPLGFDTPTEQLLETLNHLVSALQARGVIPGYQPQAPTTGSGYVNESFGSFQTPPPVRPSRPLSAPVFTGRQSYDSLADFMKMVSESAISIVGGVSRVQSLKVIDGTLILNDQAVRVAVPPQYVQLLPADVRVSVEASQFAPFFDYYLIRSMPRLSELQVSDTSFLHNYVSPGSRIRPDVSRYFQMIPSLQRLTIGGNTFTRRGYREELKSSDFDYYSRTYVLSGKMESGIWSWTKNRGSSAKNQWSRNDIGVCLKVIYSGGNAIFATGGALVTGATKGARSAPGVVRSSRSSLRNIFSSTKDFR